MKSPPRLEKGTKRDEKGTGTKRGHEKGTTKRGQIYLRNTRPDKEAIMPRMGRVMLPNHPHHVVQRGHNRQVVFAERRDYPRYLGAC